MVLEGSIRQLGSRLRVSAQLINVESGFQVWSERWDRELADVFAVQDEIAQAIATAFRLRLAPEDAVAGTRKTQNVDAYDRYLKGRYLWIRVVLQGTVGSQYSPMPRARRGGFASRMHAVVTMRPSKAIWPAWLPISSMRPSGRFSRPVVMQRK